MKTTHTILRMATLALGVLASHLTTPAMAADSSVRDAALQRYAVTATHAEHLQTLLSGVVVTDGECVEAMGVARLAFRDGLLRRAMVMLAADGSSLPDMLAELDDEDRRELLMLAAADEGPEGEPIDQRASWDVLAAALPLEHTDQVQALAGKDGVGSPEFTVRALLALPQDTPEERRLAARALRSPGGYARVRDAGLVLQLYLSGVEADALSAGIVGDLNGSDRAVARRTAHLVRMIGVVSPKGFGALLAQPALQDAGRRAVDDDLSRMVAGPKRVALRGLLDDAAEAQATNVEY